MVNYLKVVGTKIKENYLFVVFAISLLGVLGSLYISEIEKIPPCSLCYWQRIFMYPVAIVSFIAIYFKDTSAYRYILAFSGIGTLIATYHNLLQSTEIFVNQGEGCDATGITCANPTLAFEIGNVFVSLEFLSLVAFITIFFLTLFSTKIKKLTFLR